MADVRVYGAPWCPDCRRSKQFLGEQRVAYDWIDIDADPEGLRFVEELQGGGRTIPTIVFPDGSHLLEPSNDELAAAAELVMGKLSGVPVAMVRGYEYPKGRGTARDMVRPPERDLFR